MFSFERKMKSMTWRAGCLLKSTMVVTRRKRLMVNKKLHIK